MLLSNKFVKFSIFVLFCLVFIQNNIVRADSDSDDDDYDEDDIDHYDYQASGTVYCTTAEPMELNRTDPEPFIVPPALVNVKVEIGVELWRMGVQRQDLPEVLFDETNTNKMGQFNLSAGGFRSSYYQREKPYLLITHKCQQENGSESLLKEECSYVSRILLEKGQKHLELGKTLIENIGIFLGLNVAKLNGTKVEIKNEIKCE